jgi:flagellar basal body-associated protein FliL
VEKLRVTTKKAVILIVSIILALVLLVVVFVGAIVGIAFYSIGNSQAAETSKAFLKKNEILKRDIGTVNDFGSFVTGNVNVQNSDGVATLSLKVIGEKKTVNATVDLAYKDGHAWRVTGARYTDENGRSVDLLNESGVPAEEDTQRE